MVFLHHHGTQEGRHGQNGERAAYGIGRPVPAGQQMTDKREEEGEHDGSDRGGENGIDQCIEPHLAEHAPPQVAAALARGMAHGDVVERSSEAVGQIALQPPVAGLCGPDHVRSEEGGYHRHGHHHRIEELADDAKRQPQRGDDKGKLAYLCHGEAALHGRAQRLAADKIGHGSEYALADEDGEHDGTDGPGIG